MRRSLTMSRVTATYGVAIMANGETPKHVYLGALKYYFGDFVFNGRDPKGKRYPVRVAYRMARMVAAHYAFRHNYTSKKTLTVLILSN